MPRVQVVVIGGGAAGFFGAITCAEANPAAQVTLLERNASVLGKVRISGGGRCNVTHACFDPAELVTHYPRGSLALRGPFTRFQPRDTVTWFESRGVQLKAERDGRIFPITDDSMTIVNCLIGAACEAGVRIQTKVAVSQVISHESRFVIEMNNERIECDRLLLATGSSATGWRWARALNHTITSPVPSLFTFKITDAGNQPDARLDGLAGVSVENAIVRLDDVETGRNASLQQIGAVLVTHWGLSGPAILKLSAFGARELHDCDYQAGLEINWLPDARLDDLIQQMTAFKRMRGGQRVNLHSPFGQIPQRLWQRLCQAAEIHDEQRWAKLPKTNLLKLADELHHGCYRITGKGQFKEEFVTCGGVDLDEVNFRTMESRIVPGLHFAGEILDIDGVTGGFNFQSAWTTGWLAGKAMAES
jgi:predicted Rossmann fold flavoprotein